MIANGYFPALSLVTGLFEVGAAVWILGTFRRTKMHPKYPNMPLPKCGPVSLYAGILLLVLAGYQFLEIMVCAKPEETLLARIAFADVVWLPPVALMLLSVIVKGSNEPNALPVWAHRAIHGSLLMALGLAIWVVVFPDFVVGTVCSAVIATFHHGTPFHHVYGGTYELGLAGLIFGSAIALKGIEGSTEAARVAKNHLVDLQTGTWGFMIPSFIAQIAIKDLDPSLPSLMCHFAGILAIFLLRIGIRDRKYTESKRASAA